MQKTCLYINSVLFYEKFLELTEIFNFYSIILMLFSIQTVF